MKPPTLYRLGVHRTQHIRDGQTAVLTAGRPCPDPGRPGRVVRSQGTDVTDVGGPAPWTVPSARHLCVTEWAAGRARTAGFL